MNPMNMNMNQMNMNQMNNMNLMNSSKNNNLNKEEIISHLYNQNLNMMSLIEANNILIGKLRNDINNQNNSSENNFEDFPDSTGERIEIIFIANTGSKIRMFPPKNITISKLLSAYMKKVNLNDNLIDTKIKFIYNAAFLKKDDNKTLLEYRLKNHSTITVFDAENIMR